MTHPTLGCESLGITYFAEVFAISNGAQMLQASAEAVWTVADVRDIATLPIFAAISAVGPSRRMKECIESLPKCERLVLRCVDADVCK